MGVKGAGNVARSRGREVLGAMGDVVANTLEKHGIEKRRASEFALEIMEDMREMFGGQNIYFPAGSVIEQSAKYAEIYDKYWAGTSINDLAHEYKYSVIWIYAVIRSERSRRKAERDAAEDAYRKRERERFLRER